MRLPIQRVPELYAISPSSPRPVTDKTEADEADALLLNGLRQRDRKVSAELVRFYADPI